MKVESPRGTRDFTPEEMRERDYVEKTIRGVLESFSFRKIATPTFEYAELFSLKSGEDIKNRMYVFEDKGGRTLCLRPELTASVCRMFANELRNYPKPLRLYYMGPMFRYEEPQKGRYREFYQMGVEVIGAQGSLADAEVISCAAECLNRLGLTYTLQVSSLRVLRGLLTALGVEGERQNKAIALLDEGKRDELAKLLDDDTVLKLVAIKGGRSELARARKLVEGFDEPCKALDELDALAVLLEAAGVSYVVDLSIARGLEYYTGMVFEIRVAGLGAQNQICGGGRYDNLIELFGGPRTPAVGFAFGFDRVCEALKAQGLTAPSGGKTVVVAPVGEEAGAYALKVAGELRKMLAGSDIRVELEVSGRKLAKVLEYASEKGVDYVAIVGEREREVSEVTLRDMKQKTQENLPVAAAVKRLLEGAPDFPDA